MRCLLSDLGRRSGWAAGVGSRDRAESSACGDGIDFGGALLLECNSPTCYEARVFVGLICRVTPLPTYGGLFFSLIRNYKLLTAGCFSLNSFDMSLSSSRVLSYLLKRPLASTSPRRAPAFFHTSSTMSSSASIAPAPAANILQSKPPAVSSRQSYVDSSRPSHWSIPDSNIFLRSADYDTAYPIEVRKYLRTYGLTPPAVESFETQEKRCLQLLKNKQNPIEQYQYLTHLRNSNVNLFYRLLSGNVKEITPIIYTPTVGEACQRWSELYTQPEGTSSLPV
jgi:hypothetical protein